MANLINEAKNFKDNSFLIGLEIGLFLENPKYNIRFCK